MTFPTHVDCDQEPDEVKRALETEARRPDDDTCLDTLRDLEKNCATLDCEGGTFVQVRLILGGADHPSNLGAKWSPGKFK